METETLLKVPEAARELNVSVRTVYNLIRSGDLASVKIKGIGRRVPSSAVAEFKTREAAG